MLDTFKVLAEHKFQRKYNRQGNPKLKHTSEMKLLVVILELEIYL